MRTFNWVPALGAGLGGLVLLLAGSVAARAGELAWGGGYIGEYSTNIARTPTDEKKDVINSGIIGLAYRERSSTLTADFYGQAEYDKYKNDTYNPQDLYYVAASGVLALSPKQFYWTLGDLLRQVLRDPAAADTPTNRITVNVFDTGPDLLLRLNPTNTLAGGLRYGNDTYSDHSADADRYGAYGRWLLEIATGTTVSANYDVALVRYRDPAPRNDYRVSDYYLGWARRSPTFIGSLDLGYTTMNEYPGNVSSGDKPLVGHPLLRLAMTRQITRDESGGVAARLAYSDAAASLIGRQAEVGVEPPGGTGYLAEVPVADPYYETRGEMYFTSKGASFVWDARAIDRRLEYDYATAYDRSELIGRIGVTHLWSLLTSTTLYGEYIKTSYNTYTRNDIDTTVSLSLARRLTRYFSIALEGKQVMRRSDVPAAEYVDYRAAISIYYSTGALYVPARML